MGVLNITPDSFSDGGVHFNVLSSLSTAQEMVNSGVYVIDVGGESTRPGADVISSSEELARTIPVIQSIREKFPDVIISIDTYKSLVAEKALQSGANWINDISGGTFSKNMFEIAAKYDANIIISHIKGTPKDMQKNPHYEDVVGEICGWLDEQARKAQHCGIEAEKIIIDPGIGFGKRYEDNITILRNLYKFKSLGYKVLIGTSRKSFIGHYTGEKDPSKRDAGSYITFIWAASFGVDFIRVHNVPGTMQALKMADALLDDDIPLNS
ncbi:dihydropteroate synthase [bacterium]|nr:dihydropteroate synthase [bacterium]